MPRHVVLELHGNRAKRQWAEHKDHEQAPPADGQQVAGGLLPRYAVAQLATSPAMLELDGDAHDGNEDERRSFSEQRECAKNRRDCNASELRFIATRLKSHYQEQEARREREIGCGETRMAKQNRLDRQGNATARQPANSPLHSRPPR